MPFVTPYHLASHFYRHGHEFGAATEDEYEKMADAFMSQALNPALFECIRPTGTNDRVRLDGVIGWFGVAHGVLTLRTFYTKSPNEIRMAGGPLSFVTQKCSEKR